METLGVVTCAILLFWVYSRLRSRRTTPSVQDVSSSRKIPLEKFLPPELAELEVEDHYIVRVAGVSYQNDDGSNRQEILARCTVPEILELRRQPTHRHDKNAIQVRRQNGEMLGFIPKDEARVMAPELDMGRRYVALLATLDGGTREKRSRGAGVLIAKIKDGTSA